MKRSQQELVLQARFTLRYVRATKEQRAWAHGVLQALGLEPKK